MIVWGCAIIPAAAEDILEFPKMLAKEKVGSNFFPCILVCIKDNLGFCHIFKQWQKIIGVFPHPSHDRRYYRFVPVF